MYEEGTHYFLLCSLNWESPWRKHYNNQTRKQTVALFQIITVNQFHCFSCRELLTNVLDMVSVLISVVSNTESTHGQSPEESRKAAFTLFKKLKVYSSIVMGGTVYETRQSSLLFNFVRFFATDWGTNHAIETFWLRNSCTVYETQNERLCTLVDLPTLILAF